MLNLNDQLECAIGCVQLTSSLVCLSQQVMRDVIRRIHLLGVIQIVQRLDRLLQLEKRFTKKNVGSGRLRFKQHRAVERQLGVFVLPVAQIGIAETIVEVGVERIDGALCLKLANRSCDVGTRQCHFAQQFVSQGQGSIDGERLGGFSAGFVAQLAAQEETASQQVGLSRVRRKSILGRKRVARVVVSLDVGITKSQD